MAKKTAVFFCRSCGYESSKWMGQCPGCREWNTFDEEPTVKTSSASGKRTSNAKPVLLSEVTSDNEQRIDSKISELNRVLGGGIVKGSLVLIGGDPGIGKSTLLLQVTKNLSEEGHKILYVSGEESLRQIRLRADRLGSGYDKMYLLCETNLEDIKAVIEENKPEVVVIDSIQTMFTEAVTSAPGSVSQVREATAILLQIAKQNEISIYIVGHVTKEGAVAGPRVLEHMVDTVLYFEGDRHASYRVLRGVKNRFGSTNEIGVFEMRQEGLVEVANPSEYMLNGRAENASGSVVTCSMEGSRPVMVEIQALVSRTNFGIPRRQATGVDFNRVNLLMAVIEKRAGLTMGDMDAYVNLAGGLKINEPAMDLATTMAIISSFKNKPIDSATVVFGEVGLSGEIRAVSAAGQRIREALKLGFKSCIIPKANLNDDVKNIKGIEIHAVSDVNEAKNLLT